MEPPQIPPLARSGPDIEVAWRGPSLLIVDSQGWAGAHPLSGYYFRQARFLRSLRFELNGEPPYPCSHAERAPNELEFTYVYPPVERGGGGGSGSGGGEGKHGLPLRGIDLRLLYRVRPASLEATLWITNRWQEQAELDLAWIVDADYASVDEAHFGYREETATVDANPRDGGLIFRYRHPDLPVETRISGSGAEWTASADRLSAQLVLRRQATHTVSLRARAMDPLDPLNDAGAQRREGRLRHWFHGIARLDAPAETPLVQITNRAVTDLGSLALLEGAEDEWLAPAAGVPLYLTFWARDALTTAWQAGIFDGGEMLTDVLTFLARRQGERVDPAHDEQPGRILNQARTDPPSRLGKTPFRRYYADFASPFMFIIGLGYLYVLSGNKERIRDHWEAAQRVLTWAREYGDRDGDGYLEYLTEAELGPTHQGWKDSENAVVDEQGRQVDPPLAPCEVQGYYHASLQYMAALSVVLGERKQGRELWRQAAELKKRFNQDFWMEEEGCIAFGLDVRKRPIRALTSNAGHCLPSGIVADEHIPRLVERLFAPDLFSGWGIRTLSARNPAYNPLDYHLGSVWPVENASILFGLRRYGLNDRAVQLARGLYDLARLWPGGRTPECVGGYSRDELAHPGVYPRANHPQTWNQSVFPLLTQSLLGLVPFAPLRLLLVDPILPPWLPELTVEGMRIGDATATLRFWRDDDGRSHYRVIEKTGRLRVLRQPWLESRSVGIRDRVGPLLRSVLHWRT